MNNFEITETEQTIALHLNKEPHIDEIIGELSKYKDVEHFYLSSTVPISFDCYQEIFSHFSTQNKSIILKNFLPEEILLLSALCTVEIYLNDNNNTYDEICSALALLKPEKYKLRITSIDDFDEIIKCLEIYGINIVYSDDECVKEQFLKKGFILNQ